MYKRLVMISLFTLVLFSSFVFGQEGDTKPPSPKTAPLPQSISSQQVADVVHKVMTEQKADIVEDINKHMDENFGQLDARIMSNNRLLFRKAIFGILGGMTVVLIGYAFLINRVSRKYDINFYEKMIESKVASLNRRLPGYLYLDTMYKAVTFTEQKMVDRFETPQYYFDDISKKREISRDQSMKIKEELINDMKKIALKHRQKKIVKELEKSIKPLQKGFKKEFKFKLNKRLIFYVLSIILLIVFLVIYFYFKYFKTTVNGGV